MKIKLSKTTIDTNKIKKLHRTPKRLYDLNVNKSIKVKYSIEYWNGDFIPINKQEYKMIRGILGSDKE